MMGTTGFALEQLTAGYPGRPVLQGVTLPAVPAGTLVAVVGPNAVGKSTLLKAVAGLRPSQGRVLLEGTDLATLPPRERLRRVGYLPQALPQSTSLVAYETWQSALRASRSEWSSAQREAAIESVVAALGLQALALRRLDELSGGQRQMVGLAQVIVRAPRLLLLDEPTSALDLRWQLQVLQAVRAMAQQQGAVGLVAVHDLNLALRFCQHVLVLGGGSVLAAGDPAEVLTPALLQRAYGVLARVERCSEGNLLVLADTALPL
ncbi:MULTISPECIES: ABC transporter ATP-binding protein [unclassified Acidovorax]|uniref:ABC transporter ATP-binding protein n=1 Tax=unclassified Acidovorax TaxID=2684926 RepID=UPI0010D92037|nr:MULTISPECIES: ABC transporter ATP-binding protein [unclassified Acidovorax]MCZ8219474.1 ABC transporter ATP-binding protein [Acidovorax sp.]GDY36353.1 iron ABC transporter ATP-binding protein [Acidovorax sp. NB1]